MDVVKFQGRLGNQMFQYAFMEALISQGREVLADLEYYVGCENLFILNKVFPRITFDKYSGNGIKNVVEKQFWKYDPSIILNKNCMFDGFWQNELYFSDVKDKVRSLFLFENLCDEIKENAKKLSDYTSIHVRRTDYVGTHLDICSKKYYLDAIKYIERNSSGRFVIFSDDYEWVKSNISGANILYGDSLRVEGHKDSYDMYMMSKCQNNIICNSTFSWWAAWLNNNANKIVIAPKKWNSVYEGNGIVDVEGWIKI